MCQKIREIEPSFVYLNNNHGNAVDGILKLSYKLVLFLLKEGDFDVHLLQRNASAI